MILMVPIGNAIDKLLIGNGDSIILLSFFNFHLNLMILSEIRDLLHGMGCTFESIQPCLTPSLFMATKFFSGSLRLEAVCCCQPETTVSIEEYPHVRRIDLWLEPCRRCGLVAGVSGIRPCSCLVPTSAAGCFPSSTSRISVII